MKRFATVLMIAFLLGVCANSFAQYIVSSDNANNYSGTWSDQDNGGFGFGAWNLWSENQGGHFMSSSAGDGFGNIDVNGVSFGMYGNPSGTNFSHAKRAFLYWSDGAVFSFQVAIAYRNGNKGFDLYGTGDEFLFNFNASDDQYKAQGIDLGWDYNPTSVFNVVVTQTGADLDVLILRDGDSYSTTISGKSLESFKFYCGSTDQGNELNNLYFNSLKVSYPDPQDVPETADVEIEGDVTLGATQTLTVNDLSVGSGSSFTIASDASQTGSLIVNGEISDEISVQRFLSAGWDWHFLSSPVVDQPIVGAANFIEFPSGIGDISVDFYKYGEAETNGQPWINIKNQDGSLNESFGSPSTDPYFVEGNGYLVAYEGSDVTKTFSGVPNNEMMFITLNYTETGAQGWNLVGNPFPCAIDWDVVHAQGGLDNLYTDTYYIYNEDMNGGGGGFEWYSDFINGNHTANASGKIPAMQGFFVRAQNMQSPSMYIPLAARVHDDQGYLKDQAVVDGQLNLEISGSSFHSNAFITMSDGATTGVDRSDAFMLFSLNSEVPHVYSLAGEEKLVSNHVPFPEEAYSLPLGIKTGSPGTYTITAVDVENFNNSVLVLLEDIHTGVITDLKQDPTYSFTSAESGIDNNRFVLYLKGSVGIGEIQDTNRPSVLVTENQLRIDNFDEGQYDLQLMDTMGRILMNLKWNSGEVITMPGYIAAGAYILKISGPKKQWTEKFVIR